jgi:multidrug efflux pump subunit AcrA (membrane-fusion protein)
MQFGKWIPSAFLVLATVGLGCSQSSHDVVPVTARPGAVATRVSVELAPASRSAIAASIRIVGSLVARRESIIVSEVDGVVAEIGSTGHEPAAPGQESQQFALGSRINIGVQVAKGDVLVKLDPTEYQLKLQAAKARLTTAEKELANLYAWRRDEEVRRAQAAHEEAAAQVELADSELKRAQELIERGAIVQATMDQRRTTLKTANAALSRADAELALAQAGPTQEEIAVGMAAIEQARAEVARAEWELSRAEIRAPYDAVVTERFVDEGDSVTAMPRVEILELMDLGVLTAELAVPERYINRIQMGDTAEIQVKGSVEPYQGVVALINDKVDPSSRTFRIRVGVPNDQRRLKVGQFAQVTLQIDRTENTLTVPAKALVYTGGQANVFVYRDGTVRRQPVQLGLGNERSVEVLDGLDDGQQVVVDDPSVLSDGMAVELRTDIQKVSLSAAAAM